MFSVMQRGRPTSGTWAPSPGLVDCPEDFRAEAVDIVTRTNGVVGWEAFMIVDRLFDARRPPCDEES